ncbi:DUF1203 domain-containing protein [Pontixanthobacter sp. CEM42]|uniref:DUF1203 domain-containing protein n=1 Tax=Pontixanthobacter sp. CEM42 TaxID=2792077 RepID=UPI001AE07AAF|nr:DUF1203 domain-containing protein [Pontixanthobacter sp. CEM42]
MHYTISPLDRAEFEPMFAMDDAQLAEHGAVRVTANADQGFPCRVSLSDAKKGDELILLHHVSHDVATPYRSAYAIFINQDADQSEALVDAIPPVFEGRPIAFRGYGEDGTLKDVRLGLGGDHDEKIRALLDNPQVGYIHAHNAAHGCYAARIDRCGGDDDQ